MSFLLQKLWAVCDLATSLLYSKTTNFELKEFPAQIQLSPLYFKAHPKGENWVNPLVYIPQELVFQPPKKAGVSLYVTKKPASKSAKVKTRCPNKFWTGILKKKSKFRNAKKNRQSLFTF